MTDRIKNDFWGPAQWTALHCYAITYTPEQAPAFIAYVNALTHILPCPICREHLIIHLSRIPIKNYLTNRESIFYWTYLLHDAVNRTLGKVSPPYHIVRQYYLYKVLGI